MKLDYHSPKFAAISLCACALATLSCLHAQTLRSYTGATGTTWSDTASWAGVDQVPVEGDDVSFRNSATGTNTFDLATPFTLRTLAVASRTVETTTNNNVTTAIDLNAGTRNFTNLYVGQSDGATYVGNMTLSNGTFGLSSGVLQVGAKTGGSDTNDVTGTVTGTSGLTFNASSLTSLTVGVATAGSNGAQAFGTLDLSSVAAGTLSIASGGTASIGTTTTGTGSVGNGSLTFGNNWTSTTLGVDDTNRAALQIGRKGNNGTSTGSFTQTGGTFNAFLSTLDVGHSAVGNGAAVSGTLTLTGTSPTIDTTALNIGNARGSLGVVTLGNNATLTVGGGNVNVGNGGDTSTSQLVFGTGGSFTVSGGGNIVVGRANTNVLTTAASVSLGSSSTSFGTSGNRTTALSIGTRPGNTTGLSTGSLTQTGGSFTAYLAGLNVGQVTSGNSGGLNTGTLDLTGVGTLLLDVSGTTNIGRGRVAAGSVTTGLGTFNSGTTNIGDTLGDASGASLNLNKTTFTSGITTSSGILTVDVLGQINATVGTNNAGVNQGGITIINQNAGALLIYSATNMNNEGIQFTFENFNTSLWEIGHSGTGNFDTIYYALKWQGVDRTTTVNDFITANKISAVSAVGTAPTVFYEGGNTYYGYYLKSINGDAYTNWINSLPPNPLLPDAASKLPEADPDGDGNNNLGEFAFGGDPTKGDDLGQGKVQLADTDTDTLKELTLTLQVRSGATFAADGPDQTASVDGISYRIEGDNSLTSFDSTVTPVTPPLGIGSPKTGYAFKSFRLVNSNGLTGKGFLRAKAQRP